MNYTRSSLLLFGRVRYPVSPRLSKANLRNLRRIEGWTPPLVQVCITVALLREMKTFTEIVACLHDVGQALVRNVEEVDERLNIACLE